MSVDAELAERVRDELMGEALTDPHARRFDMTGRPMKGWILVERAGLETEAELNAWVRQGVELARGLPAKR